MGTTRKFKYRIECRTNDTCGVNSNARGLHVYGADKLPKNLQEWCETVEKSELKGGVNEHAAHIRGYLLAIHSAKVIRQSDEKIMLDYKAAPFRVLA